MKPIWFLVSGLLSVLVITKDPVEAQNAETVQKQMPNQMEPLNRRARQWWSPNGPAGGWTNTNGPEWWIPHPYTPPSPNPNWRGGGGWDSMAWACDILCPDDDIDIIPYRAPRPTKGKFIPIHG